MSDLVPFDIQTEIIKKLPIKSLIRFRSVSKPWKSLIDSSKFIHDNCLRDNQPHHLLVRYKLDSLLKYVSIIDDDSFPQHKNFPAVPVTLNRSVYNIGSSHGIICLYVFCQTGMIVLWNSTIQKSVGIVLPNVVYTPYTDIVIGFGVCPNTSDPKLVKIKNTQSTINCVSWEVEVFTLSTGVWRTISVAMPFKPVKLLWHQVFINGVIYWHGYTKIDASHENRPNRIISFDLKSEELGEVLLSDSLVHSTADVFIMKMMGSLAVIESFFEPENNPVCVVWKMNDGALKSLTKLYTVKAYDGAFVNKVLEFRKNGEPIMESVNTCGDLTILEVYEPCSGHFKDLRLEGTRLLTSCSM